MRYRERWFSLLHILYGYIPFFKHSRKVHTCENWMPFHHAVLLDVSLDPRSLLRFPDIVNKHKDILNQCTHCRQRAGWIDYKIADGITAIPRFSAI